MILVIAEDELQSWKARCGCPAHNLFSSPTIIDASCRDEYGEKQTHAIYQDMAFSSLVFFAPVVASLLPPAAAEGTDWLSITPKLGDGARPA